MLKHYVEFSFPEAFFGESQVREVVNRSPELITVPDRATEYTSADVKANFPEYTILISNMECNGWD